jgi:hypothetical protein
MIDAVKYVLDDTRLPKTWYNLMAASIREP